MIGVNTFGLAYKMKDDIHGTIQRLADMGAELVEPLYAPFQKKEVCPKVVLCAETAAGFCRDCRALGMDVKTMHIFVDLSVPVQALAEDLIRVSKETGVHTFVFSGAMESEEMTRTLAGSLSELARRLKAENCKVFYHNHAPELKSIPVGDSEEMALNYFFRCCSEDVLFQLDIGWAGLEHEELEIATRFADRIGSIHCKDYAVKGNKPEFFLPIGSGVIRTKEVLNMIPQFPNFNGTVIIDQDNSAGDILADVAQGIAWLKGNCHEL